LPAPQRSAVASRPRSAAPFGDVRLGLLLAALYGGVTLVWIGAGGALPGGRWVAVHLFTLGVLSNAILTFTHHFGRTLTRTNGPSIDRWTLAANVGIPLLLAGTIGLGRGPMVVGATLLTVVVTASWWRLRRMRQTALGARFTWVVRCYERAHGNFLHGALLGVLLGLGMFPGSWYVGARMAHLHANVLGWGGLTLLATLVFFGPTLVRAQMEPSASDRAARHLRHAATALSIAVVLMLLSGLPGVLGSSLRVTAGVALAGFAAGATSTLVPIWRVARGAQQSSSRLSILALTGWFVLGLWADVLIVLTGRWEWLDALGAVLLAGVLAPAIFATAAYLAPILRGRTTVLRETLRERLESGRRLRAITLNLGVLLAVAAAGGLFTPRVGWVGLLMIGAAFLSSGLLIVTVPSPATAGTDAPSRNGSERAAGSL